MDWFELKRKVFGSYLGISIRVNILFLCFYLLCFSFHIFSILNSMLFFVGFRLYTWIATDLTVFPLFILYFCISFQLHNRLQYSFIVFLWKNNSEFIQKKKISLFGSLNLLFTDVWCFWNLMTGFFGFFNGEDFQWGFGFNWIGLNKREAASSN